MDTPRLLLVSRPRNSAVGCLKTRTLSGSQAIRDITSELCRPGSNAPPPAAATLTNTVELRGHAQQILEAIVDELATPQTPVDQSAKSRGLAPVPVPASVTAAQTHAVLRAKSGFDIKQLASEYRALRAGVLSLWLGYWRGPEDPLEAVIRFNEAIDQALAESIAHFHAEVGQARNLLLGMPGQDIRSPRQTIQTTSLYLARLNAGEPSDSAARRFIDSGARMQRLVEDPVDFDRASLGLGIAVETKEVSLAELCERKLEQLRSAYPAAEFTAELPKQPTAPSGLRRDEPAPQ